MTQSTVIPSNALPKWTPNCPLFQLLSMYVRSFVCISRLGWPVKHLLGNLQSLWRNGFLSIFHWPNICISMRCDTSLFAKIKNKSIEIVSYLRYSINNRTKYAKGIYIFDLSLQWFGLDIFFLSLFYDSRTHGCSVNAHAPPGNRGHTHEFRFHDNT